MHFFQFLGQSRVVGIGGKGVGKSTMLRYIANRLIQERGQILWIDLDPGQAEFTIPGTFYSRNICIFGNSGVVIFFIILGCLSCTLVKEPLLGPNFTHLAQDNLVTNIYLGSVNVSDVAKRYFNSVQHIIREISLNPNFSKIPWVINTMGFNRGLGISLLKKSMSVIQPTTFIEVRSRFAKKNFECSLKGFCEFSLPKCHYMKFDAIPESDVKDMNSQDFWGIPEAYKLRDIVLLSYIGERFPAPIQNLTPYSVSFDNVQVQLLQCQDKSLTESEACSVLNMSLVSLGSVDRVIDQNDIIESKGFGIIRGIDPERRLFYVLTDCDSNPEDLETINCITSGSINLPNGIFLTKVSNKLKHSPYVESKPPLETPLNVPWQRSGKPRLNEFQNKS